MTELNRDGEPTTFWVAETGCYSDRGVGGIFASPQLAMGAYPKGKWTRALYLNYPRTDPPTYWEEFENDLDWDEHVSISPMTVITSGPTREVDKVEAQRDTDGGRGLAYDELTHDQADEMLGRR